MAFRGTGPGLPNPPSNGDPRYEVGSSPSATRLRVVPGGLSGQRRSVDTGSGGGDSTDMPTWEETVETRLGELRSDTRKLLYAGLVAFGVLAGGGLALYVRLDNKIDHFAERVSDRFDRLDERLNTILERLPAPQKSAP